MCWDTRKTYTRILDPECEAFPAVQSLINRTMQAFLARNNLQ